MKRTISILLLTVSALALTPATAFADATAFFGLSPNPAARSTRGFAFGLSLIVVGFEIEYGNTAEAPTDAAPSLRTGMINGLVQTPTSHTQFYLTAGGGLYRERLGSIGETNVGTNVGGGIKMSLAGPVRLRLDYRVFTLRGGPAYKNPQRIYAGLNVSF
jgi:opacity protein-like surface antigen